MISTLILFFIGIVLYSFIEYAVHRWLLHGPLSKLHTEHHANPNKQVTVPLKLALPSLFVLWLAFGWAVTLGVAIGWWMSGRFHDNLHNGNPSDNWKSDLWFHHLGHHNHPEANFGVTSRVWDRLFGTVYTRD